ncbi:SRPBCC family protein [Tumidithrix elongata RA019]|uniref:SRPBCC family protein n=1 Tax=Tumidithrix elongata BACA0141 TaxID=2716417 RepID=A0AAW9PW92_9CYAN|nr:SRPBCC family protein [Tumidithrix elongata RA019]
MYHFIAHWYFNAPIEHVWKEIEDTSNISGWLRDFRKVTPRSVQKEERRSVDIDVEYRGDLPYTFRFSMRVIKVEPPHLLELEATGNLIGRGKWVLRSQDQGKAATYFWDVTVANPFFALFVKFPWFKAITERNHNATMDRAYQALKQKL